MRFPYDLWGLLSETWKPAPEEGVTVFLQGLEKRGPHNRRKRIYMTAVTPDLYRPMYGDKVVAFFDKLLDDANAGKPLMRPYLENYFDLYWDLHLGVKPDAIPQQVHDLGQAFNTVLAYRDPTQKIVYDNYLTVRANLAFLKSWIDDRLADLENGKTPNPEKTFAWYWLKNAGDGEYFAHKDVVFEVFHNFVALSQWGNSLYNIMLKLATDTGDPETRAWFKKTMEGNPDDAGGEAFHAARAVRDGAVPHDLPERRKHIGDGRNADAALSAARLCGEPAHLDESGPGALEGSGEIQSGPLQERADQPRHQRGEMRANRLRQMPLQQRAVRCGRRTEGGDEQ